MEIEGSSLSPVPPPRRKKTSRQRMDAGKFQLSSESQRESGTKLAGRGDIPSHSAANRSPKANLHVPESNAAKEITEMRGRVFAENERSLRISVSSGRRADLKPHNSKGMPSVAQTAVSIDCTESVSTPSRPPLSPRAARHSAKLLENVKESESEGSNGIRKSRDWELGSREDVGALSDSSAISGKTESPKKKPVRPELPKRYSSSKDPPSPKPTSQSPTQYSPTSRSLLSPNNVPTITTMPRNPTDPKSESDFRIIDSRVKSLERKFSKGELQGRETITSPSRRTAHLSPTLPPRQLSYKEHVLKKAQHETSISSSVRSVAQSFISRMKSSTLPRSMSSNGKAKSSNMPPDKPPRPAPPSVDRPIYETVKNIRDTDSSYPIYSYIDISNPWGGSTNRKDFPVSASLSTGSSVGECMDGRVYTALDPKTVSGSPEYATCFPLKIEDSGSTEEDVYIDMSGLSLSSGSTMADSSSSLSSHPPSSDSPVVTKKHLLPTESHDEEDDDYMFMSSLTLEAPSIYMKTKPLS